MKNFSGANFCFWVSSLVLGVSVVFCLGFCFIFWRLAPENVRKILFMSGPLFLWVCFSLSRFSVVAVFFVFAFVVFFKRDSSGLTGHTPHCTLWSCFFPFFVPAAPGLSPALAVSPFLLAFCRGAILGPGRFGDFWILSEHWGA